MCDCVASFVCEGPMEGVEVKGGLFYLYFPTEVGKVCGIIRPHDLHRNVRTLQAALDEFYAKRGDNVVGIGGH